MNGHDPVAAGFKAYRHLPTKVQAAQITRDNIHALAEICGGRVTGNSAEVRLMVPTPQGERPGNPDAGDWLIRGVVGEWYPVLDVVFRNCYANETTNGG